MADLLQALAADLIANAGVSPSAPISSHPDLLRRYTELSKVIQVWHTEGDKVAVRREANLIKAQLAYNKEVIGAQKTFSTNSMKERNNAINALAKLEGALVAASSKLTVARNTQSEYIMHKVAKVASRLGSRGSGPRAWGAINGILGEEGLIGRVPDPALPLLLARMKDTYGDSNLGPSAQRELEILQERAERASVVQKAALERNKRALRTVESLTSRAQAAGNNSPELAQVIKEAQGFSGKIALFMEEEVGLKNKAELAARLENLKSQGDTLERLEVRHKALDELLGRGGGSNSERQTLANMISHPRFRAWAESNGYEVNALGVADRASGGKSAVLTSYVSGRDDLKAVLHFQRQLAHPNSYRSIMNPFGQRSRSGKYVVVTDKVSQANAARLQHKTGDTAGEWVTVRDRTGTVRALSERQYREHQKNHGTATVRLLEAGGVKYAESDGVYYKLLSTGKWAQQSGVPAGIDDEAVASKPLMYLQVTGEQGVPARFATVADLTGKDRKPMATKNSSGLMTASVKSMATIRRRGGEITKLAEPPVGMVYSYRGELLTQHAIDVRNSRNKGAVDVKVHGPDGIRTFSGDDPIVVDIVLKDDDTGLSDLVDVWQGQRREETVREAEEVAPTEVVTTQMGPHTIIDRSNVSTGVFGAAINRIKARRVIPGGEGLATPEEQERRRQEREELKDVSERAPPVEGIRDIALVGEEPPTPAESAQLLGAPSKRPLQVPPAKGGPPMPRPGPIGDVRGATYAETGPKRREAVQRHIAAQRTLGLTAGGIEPMPELDRLREAADAAQGASDLDTKDEALKTKARAAKSAYTKAAKAQLKDRKDRARHVEGESIEQIQEPPAPVPAPAPAPRQPPVQAETSQETAREAYLDAARNIGILESGGSVGYAGGLGRDERLNRARANLDAKRSEWQALETVDEAEIDRQTQSAVSQGRTAGVQQLQAEQRAQEEAAPRPRAVQPVAGEIDPGAVETLLGAVRRAREPVEVAAGAYTPEQAAWSSYKAADKVFRAANAASDPGLESARMARLEAKNKYRDEWLELNPGANEQDFMRAMNKYRGMNPLPPLSQPVPAPPLPPSPQRGEDIGTKLRQFLGLGTKGERGTEIVAPVQEELSAPQEGEVPGRGGLQKKAPPERQLDEDEEGDNE